VKSRQGLDQTLFDRILSLYGDECVRMLTVQYRMHEHISDWCSGARYQGKLTSGVSVSVCSRALVCVCGCARARVCVCVCVCVCAGFTHQNPHVRRVSARAQAA
jgi:hypothetical protein